MDLNPIVLSIPVFFVLILLEWVYDLATSSGSYRLGDALGNIGCGIFEQSTGLLAKVFAVGLYTVIYEWFHLFEIERNWVHAIWLFLGVDFLYYWAHRMSHEVNLFWLGHVVHHQSEDYNLSVALRQGAIQKIFTSPFYLPLAVIGFAPEWFLYVLAWNTLYQFWIHTEKIGRLGIFEWFLNTPSHHRVHHGRDPKYIDRNHGATLIIWDRIFGTFQKEEERPHYGITKPVGSFNPIVAHWKPFSDLAEEANGLTIRERLKLLFASPGWRPERLGGFQTAPEVTSEDKYTPSLSPQSSVLLLIYFLILLGFAALFLFSAPDMNYTETGAAVLVLSALLYYAGMWSGGNRPSLWLGMTATCGLALWIGVTQVAQIWFVFPALLFLLILAERFSVTAGLTDHRDAF